MIWIALLVGIAVGRSYRGAARNVRTKLDWKGFPK